jgi:hypothetical protein
MVSNVMPQIMIIIITAYRVHIKLGTKLITNYIYMLQVYNTQWQNYSFPSAYDQYSQTTLPLLY